MSFFKFTKKKDSFLKERRFVYGVPGKLWDSLGRLLDATTKVLDLTIKGIDWVIDLPGNIEVYAKTGYAYLKHKVENIKNGIKSPGRPNDSLPAYTKYNKDGHFVHPALNKVKGAQFEQKPRKTNPALEAAILQQQLLFLKYLIDHRTARHKPALTEYKRLVKAMKKFKEDQIKKKAECARLQQRVVILNGLIGPNYDDGEPDAIPAGQLGTDSETGHDYVIERRKHLSKIAILSRKDYPREIRGTYKMRQVEFPRGSGQKVWQFHIESTPKVTMDYDKSIKEMEKLQRDKKVPGIKEVYDETKVYESEIKKLAYWRDIYYRDAKKNKPGEIPKYHAYDKYAQMQYAAYKKNLVAVP